MSIRKIQQFSWIPLFSDEIKLLLYPRARISPSFWKKNKVKGKENHCYFTGKRLWWKDFWLCRVTSQNHTNWLCFMQNWSVSILWKKRLHWNRTSSSRRIRWNERNYNEIWIGNGYYAKKSKINLKKYCKTKK